MNGNALVNPAAFVAVTPSSSFPFLSIDNVFLAVDVSCSSAPENTKMLSFLIEV